ncbi:hypothetical protein [Massilia sp. TS11]|uniref:hypothetical protein n=1 Tax=Massilia sp. TS11 TaxID=2908003 RepID=UPI001EDC709F|nr:hypothetical protein [Massilia sp. TS11]MCG2585452.1 hypothetical protein [Massilia sp. TS11]
MRRRLLLLSLLSLPQLVKAQARSAPVFLLFGGPGALYAYLLPSYRNGQAQQLLCRIHLDEASIDQALRAQLAGSAAVWTLEGQAVLPERLAPGERLSARVLSGHPARGGSVRWHSATVVIDEILQQRPLSAAASQDAPLSYQRYGNFLIKEIDSRPDFIHVVQLEKPAGLSRFSLARHGLLQPDVRSLEAASGARIRATLYFDNTDLQ